MTSLIIIALALSLAIGGAQNIDISDLPICAQGCLINAISEQNSCTAADVACLCKNSDFVNAAACCLSSNCDSADQTKAISANVKLCATVNVTVPNYLGCSPSLASKFTSVATASQSISAYNGVIQSAISVPTSGPVATFTGGALFTGTCTSPIYAVVTMLGGGVLEYPWAGCSNDRPSCCPFEPDQGGLLSVCPSEYTTTSNACCPSGWSIHTSSIGNQIPCVSTLASPLAAPSVTGLRKRAPVTVIVTTQLYTLKYALKPKKSGLSVGAKAGIVIGAVLAFLFGALLVAFIVHKRKLRSRGLREGTIIGGGSFHGSKRSGTFSQTGSHPGYLSDMHSVVGMQQGIPVGGGFWIPPPGPEPLATPPPPPIPPQELPASTHMHEHHPAFQPSNDAPEPPPVHVLGNHGEPQSHAALISPMEGSKRQ